MAGTRSRSGSRGKTNRHHKRSNRHHKRSNRQPVEQDNPDMQAQQAQEPSIEQLLNIQMNPTMTHGLGLSGGSTFTPQVMDDATLKAYAANLNPAETNNLVAAYSNNVGDTSKIGAKITLYVTQHCGTCAYVEKNILPQFTSKYIEGWKKSVVNGTQSAPLIEVSVTMVPSSDPRYLPNGVTEVPSITLEYLHPDGRAASKKKVYYSFKDLADAAEKNPKWVVYDPITKIANELYYEWLPTNLRILYPSWMDVFSTYFII